MQDENRSPTAVALRVSSSAAVTEESFPASRRTRQVPQIPTPPQTADRSAPAFCAATSKLTSVDTSRRLPMGSNSTR